MTDTVRIGAVRVAAAHDGSAELQVTLIYPNGGRAEITLDEPAGRALMTACDAQDMEDLIGQRWERVRDALSVSFNRLQSTSAATELPEAR